MARQVIKYLVIGLAVCALPCQAQKLVVEKSYVSFFSDAAIEDIKAENNASSSILNPANGEVAFSIPIAEFQFEKNLMRQHFNEKYMETEKYPRSTFTGKIEGYQQGVSGKQDAVAKGKLTIHGVTRPIEVPGSIEFVGEKAMVNAKFVVRLADYKVKIPQLLWQNIAEEVEVTVDFTYKPMN